MYSYFDMCLLDNALEEWHSVTPHEDDQMVKNFKYPLKEWFIALLPDNAFLTQKEWLTNTMNKLYTMKVKDFGNRLKTLNCYLTLMPYNDKKDTLFTDTDFKALLCKCTKQECICQKLSVIHVPLSKYGFCHDDGIDFKSNAYKSVSVNTVSFCHHEA